MIDKIKRELGPKHHEFVMRLAKGAKVKPDVVLSVLRANGSDLTPGIIKTKVTELELMQSSNSPIGMALRAELKSYNVELPLLKGHLATLKYLRDAPLDMAKLKLAGEIRAFMSRQSS